MNWITGLPLYNSSTNKGIPTDIKTYKLTFRDIILLVQFQKYQKRKKKLRELTF